MLKSSALNVALLLEAIPGADPVGADPRADEGIDYGELQSLCRESRSADRARDKAGNDDERRQVPPSRWVNALQAAEKITRERGKDLRVMAFLAEAATQVHGLAGLRDAFDVLSGLVESSWAALHPRMDDPSDPERTRLLDGLCSNGRDCLLARILNKLACTPSADPGPHSFWQCVELRRAGALDEAIAAAKLADAEFYPALTSDIRSAITATSRLQNLLLDRQGSNAVSLIGVRETLDAMIDLIRQITGKEFNEDSNTQPPLGSPNFPGPSPMPPSAAMQSVYTNSGSPLPPSAETPRSREQALNALAAIAAYFRVHEPHSPLSYTLDDAIRRARMPLPALLAELVPDKAARNALMMNAGIYPAPDPDEGN